MKCSIGGDICLSAVNKYSVSIDIFFTLHAFTNIFQLLGSFGMSSNSRRWEVQPQSNQNEQLQPNNEPAQEASTSKQIQEEANE